MVSQRISGLALCLIVLISAGCDQAPDTVMEEAVAATPADVMTRPELMGEVVVNHVGVAISNWGSDRYVIQTRGGAAPVVEGDTLALTVSYGGGCQFHEFTLVASEAFAESHPVELDVFLAHEANGDRCRAYLTETYGFDLTPIKRLYQEAYQKEAGTVVLLLQVTPEDVLGLLPEEVLELIYTFEG